MQVPGTRAHIAQPAGFARVLRHPAAVRCGAPRGSQFGTCARVYAWNHAAQADSDVCAWNHVPRLILMSAHGTMLHRLNLLRKTCGHCGKSAFLANPRSMLYWHRKPSENFAETLLGKTALRRSASSWRASASFWRAWRRFSSCPHSCPRRSPSACWRSPW